ncbi:MAG: nuclear transport factor 2 family protein [Acidimicrobiales bacterium]
MTAPDADVRAALRSLAERYASGVDHRAVDTLLSAFHPHASLAVHDPSDDAEPVSRREGHDEIGRIPEILSVYAKTFHLLGQSTYDIGDGRATGEVYCVAHHLIPNRHGGTDRVMYIRYDDQYEPDAEGAWKIATRKVLVDWTETHATNVPGR